MSAVALPTLAADPLNAGLLQLAVALGLKRTVMAMPTPLKPAGQELGQGPAQSWPGSGGAAGAARGAGAGARGPGRGGGGAWRRRGLGARAYMLQEARQACSGVNF